ncbi:hypothetical protein [Bacteroides sp.]|uniref:hypothetical protein n=1 Tax=Bacteroides sp. TaxID=29523 RepID=UPI00262ABE84|nr:hypothetical protein [Bacteroides sp.]MDD3038140.1 hypothetical protein [Bacteroides sp.]
MADWKNYYKKGLSQAEYHRNKAFLEKFNALESDWKKLFSWIMSIARQKKVYDPERNVTVRLADIWHHHVLTVLVEIIRKNTDEYKDTFVRSRGTVDQKRYMKNLKDKILDWNIRLDTFVRTQWLDDRIGPQDSSIQAAQSIKQHLSDALQGKIAGKFQPGRSLNPASQPYYQMLQAIRDIKMQSERYIQMIEDSGTMDASLALLLAFIRNYCMIADKFNDSLRSLPDYYRNEILKVTARHIVQDQTYLVVTPLNEGFTLPEGTRFVAGANADGDPLFYRNESSHFLTGGRLAKIYTAFLSGETSRTGKMYVQEIDLGKSSDTILFDDEHKEPSYGWMLESYMFLLREGKRNIRLSFRLSDDSAGNLRTYGLTDADMDGAFDIYIGYPEGWMHFVPRISMKNDYGRLNLVFEIMVKETECALSACQEEVHGITTRYPCLQVMMNNANCPYDWARLVQFDRTGIDVEVDGIRHFNLYSELGELDSTQPFYPFGTQAERGAWFMFGNEEISGKTVEEVTLRGKWNKLPQGQGGYALIYRNYGQQQDLTNHSFQVKTEYRQNDKWYSCPDGLSPLFGEDSGELKEDAEMHFKMTDTRGMPLAMLAERSGMTYNQQRNLFFRVTLNAPSIGFGMDEYRRLFAEVMIYNSRQKENKQKEIPTLPVVPLLSDIELSYKAGWRSGSREMRGNHLWRITPYGEYEECLMDIGSTYTLLEDMQNEKNLYLQFTGMHTDRRIILYVDLSYIKKDIFFSDENTIGKVPYMELDYRKNGKWFALKPENILRDETCGMTQNGFVELTLPDGLSGNPAFWLRIRPGGQVRQYPAIRGIYLNCIRVVAENGDGTPLPVGSIQKMEKEDWRVKEIVQPLPGFSGRMKESLSEVSIRQSSRIAHRNRAVIPGDYEQMILDQFPEILKVYCLPETCTGNRELCIVVFSYTDANPYPVTPAWKLSEIRNWLSSRISPFVMFRVCNPTYRKVKILCVATLQDDAVDEGDIRRRMIRQVEDYFAPWIRAGELPELGKEYSYKELHTRLANDPDVECLLRLEIDGKQPEVQPTDIHADDQSVPDEHLPMEVVLIPYDIQIELQPFQEGIGDMEIGSNFKIE